MLRIPIMLVLMLLPFMASSEEFIGIEDISRGMKGYALTVFYGTEVDTFGVEVIDVIKDNESGLSMILVKCFGENIEKTGIAQGMSGSPVYFDNKLAGSMSYTWDNLKEPVGGVIPIKNIIDLEKYTVMPEINGYRFKEIAMPISITGIDENILNSIKEKSPILRQMSINTGIGGVQADSSKSQMAPGKGIAIKLIDGEFSASAIGTVTYIDSNKIYSLGHPFYLKGKIEYPISEAYIYTILARTDISYKMGYGKADNAGTALEDRTYGVYAEKNIKAGMIKTEIAINDTIKVKCSFVRDEDILSSMLPLVFLSTVSKYFKSTGALTVDYRIEFYPKDRKKFVYKNMVSSENVFLGAYFDMQSILYSYTGNIFEKVEMDSIKIISSVNENINVYSIWDVVLDKQYYKRGETVQGKIILKTFRGENVEQKFLLKIPENAVSDTLMLHIISGRDEVSFEVSRSEGKFQYKDLSSLEKIISELKPASFISVKLYDKEKGFTDNNREFFKMPRSFINKQILRGKSYLNSSLSDESIIETNGVINGEKTILLNLRRY